MAANMGRKAITDLLRNAKGAAATADTRDVRDRALHSGRNTASAYKELLEHVNTVSRLSSGVVFSLPFSKVIRFIRFNRQCNESSGILVHFHSGLVLYMCIQACVSCLEV